MRHPVDDYPVVFIDTPGFDDTHKSDTEILTIIANWLVKMWVYYIQEPIWTLIAR